MAINPLPADILFEKEGNVTAVRYAPPSPAYIPDKMTLIYLIL